MKRIKLFIAALAVLAFGAFVFVPTQTVLAIDPLAEVCSNGGASAVCDNQDEDANELIATLVSVLLFLVGTLAVIMIIVSGIFYVTSNGDASKVARAKNTLTYSIVGLIIAFLAYAIVFWVLDVFKRGQP